MRGTRLLAALITVGLVVGAVPGGALASSLAAEGVPEIGSSDAVRGIDGTTVATQTTGTNASDEDTSSQATVGQQLATVIAVTDDEVGGDVEASSLEVALEDANASERASILATRAATLRDRADAVVAGQRAALAAYEAGELTRGEFAQRLAVLAGRAGTIDRGFERLDEHAATASELELRAAGYDRTANDESREQLAQVTGAGTSALLAQYTGEAAGEFSLETDGGVSIEVESDDGERSREIERDQPGNGTFEVTQSEALVAATESLSTEPDGEWALRTADRDAGDGYYEFGFAFVGPTTTGEAEVSVDGQTGKVFELEEKLEPREADDAEAPLSVSIADGTTDPGATVTLRVTADGRLVENATVTVEDREVGRTDADGRLAVTLPNADEVEIAAKDGDREGELEITLRSDEGREDDELRERVSASGAVDNGTVTVSVTYDGEGVANATVSAAGERVGTTDASGTASFAAPTLDDDLEVTVVKGALEIQLEFEVESDGTLALDSVEFEQREEAGEDENAEADEADDEDAREEESESGDEEDENDAEADEEDADDDQNLSVTVVSGDPEPGATITLEVTDDSAPVSGATVTVADDRAGATDTDGRLRTTLPDASEVEIVAEDGDREGELELEFDEGTETETETDDDENDEETDEDDENDEETDENEEDDETTDEDDEDGN